MPNSYDNVTTKEAYIIYPNGSKVTSGLKRVGGGTRSWGGSQQRVKPAPLDVTNITAISTRYFDTFQTWKVGNPWTGYYTYHNQASARYGSFADNSINDTQGSARARMAANSRLASGNFNALVMAGEGRETVRFIANRMFLLYRFLRILSRGNFKEAAAVLGSELSQNSGKRLNRLKSQYRNPIDLASNGWLEYQFAVRPLVGDVYGVLKEYHERRQVGKQIYASGKYKDGPKGTVYRSGVVARVRSTELRTLQQLGITNPLLAAWELVPLSFVVDWFVPISGYLQFMDSTVGLQDVQRWDSVKTILMTRARDPAQSIESVTETYTRRGSLDIWPLPALTVGTNLNTDKLVTASSLLQRFKR